MLLSQKLHFPDSFAVRWAHVRKFRPIACGRRQEAIQPPSHNFYGSRLVFPPFPASQLEATPGNEPSWTTQAKVIP